MLVGAIWLNCSMAASDVMKLVGVWQYDWMHYGYIVLWGQLQMKLVGVWQYDWIHYGYIVLWGQLHMKLVGVWKYDWIHYGQTDIQWGQLHMKRGCMTKLLGALLKWGGRSSAAMKCGCMTMQLCALWVNCTMGGMCRACCCGGWVTLHCMWPQQRALPNNPHHMFQSFQRRQQQQQQQAWPASQPARPVLLLLLLPVASPGGHSLLPACRMAHIPLHTYDGQLWAINHRHQPLTAAAAAAHLILPLFPVLLLLTPAYYYYYYYYYY